MSVDRAKKFGFRSQKPSELLYVVCVFLAFVVVVRLQRRGHRGGVFPGGLDARVTL